MSCILIKLNTNQCYIQYLKTDQNKIMATSDSPNKISKHSLVLKYAASLGYAKSQS